MKESLRSLIISLIALAGIAAVIPSAMARDQINWSVSVGNPYPPPVIYSQPQPIYYDQQPVYVRPQPVYVRPAPIVQYQPYYAPVYPQSYYVEQRYYRRHHHHHHHDGHNGRW